MSDKLEHKFQIEKKKLTFNEGYISPVDHNTSLGFAVSININISTSASSGPEFVYASHINIALWANNHTITLN